MKVQLYISRHISLKGGRRNRRPPSVWIAVVSIALAVVVLELTLAVVAGFRSEIIRKISGFEPDISVLPAYDYQLGGTESVLEITARLEDIINESLPGVTVVKEFRFPAVLKTEGDFSAIILRGYGQGHDFGFERDNVVKGQWPDMLSSESPNRIVVSAMTARELGLDVGDKVDAYFFVDGNIKARRPEVAAIYESNFGENDKLTAYAPVAWLQKVAGVDSMTVTSLGIREGIPNDDISEKAGALQQRLVDAARTGVLDKIYVVDNITHTGAVYYSWLDLLDTNVVVIFILMACVAGFTLVASLFILILERVRTIGLLRAMGMSVRQVRDVFVMLAMRLVAAGLLIGNIFGLGIIFAQRYWNFIPLNPEMYYLSSVPVEVSWWQIAILNAAILVVLWAVMVIPAQMVSTVSPSQTMRYD